MFTPSNKKFQKISKIFENKIIKKLQKNTQKITKKIELIFSIHIGNTSTIIESLEHGLEVIHVISSDFFDFSISKFMVQRKTCSIRKNIYIVIS